MIMKQCLYYDKISCPKVNIISSSCLLPRCLGVIGSIIEVYISKSKITTLDSPYTLRICLSIEVKEGICSSNVLKQVCPSFKGFRALDIFIFGCNLILTPLPSPLRRPCPRNLTYQSRIYSSFGPINVQEIQWIQIWLSSYFPSIEVLTFLHKKTKNIMHPFEIFTFPQWRALVFPLSPMLHSIG